MGRYARSKIKLQTAKLQTCCGEGERVFTVLGGWIDSVPFQLINDHIF